MSSADYTKDQQPDAHEFLKRFTLIAGDVNAGKTTLTLQILEAVRRETDSRVTVVDFAPEMPPCHANGDGGTAAVGGALQVPASPRVRYRRPRLHPPRLTAKNEAEAGVIAVENQRAVETLFETGVLVGADALFINDCSLYLHNGGAARLLDWIRQAPTTVVNGYFGDFFGGCAISRREKEGMEFLMRRCDRLIRLTSRNKGG